MEKYTLGPAKPGRCKRKTGKREKPVPGFLEITPRGADEKNVLFGGHVKFKITPRGLISRNA